ncbi:MAG: mannose-1-phosphate guanylyltransferase, partial [Dinoroseobacter sp.]|nr:mannose-1-phosphate guanylyltransferase [Dinoroseobacter sp.]
MDQNRIYPYLLCGGSGTRLWPLSRKSYPKQFVELIGETTLFQATAQRITGEGFAEPSIVTASDFRFVVLEQLDSIGITPKDVLIEPAPKNTAAAICVAALALEKRAPGGLMLIASSDHVIPDPTRFRNAVQAAAETAQSGQLVTFGIKPDRAETGYGWLELTEQPDADFSPAPQALKSFVEKPDAAKAEALLAGNMHLWNAGIFLFSTNTILDAFKVHAPKTLTAVQESFDNASKDLAFTKLDPGAWGKCEDISIDYAVMERADNVSVVP